MGSHYFVVRGSVFFSEGPKSLLMPLYMMLPRSAKQLYFVAKFRPIVVGTVSSSALSCTACIEEHCQRFLL